MVNKCKCYHTQKELQYTYHPISGRAISHDVVVGVCWGTRECDHCNCNGDETKCDFYPEVRKKAMETSVEDVPENDVISEFKELVRQYLLDKGLYLVAVKNALEYAEKKLTGGSNE